jgi:hypothetical protein
MLNELKKHRYLNLIDITVPLKLEGTMKESEIKMLSSNVSQGILVTKEKLDELERTFKSIEIDNKTLSGDKRFFKSIKESQDIKIEDLKRQVKIKETQFVNEQILKFGTTIKFEYLLKAAKDTTVILLK